jgi:hypothetical protein
MKKFNGTTQNLASNGMVELVALRRVVPRFSGATDLQPDGNFAASKCPLRGQTLSQRDNVHHQCQCLRK